MRLQVVFGLSLLAVPLIAQQRGVFAGPQRGMYGGVSTGQMVGVINDPGFAGRLGATVSGLPQTTTQIPVQRGPYAAPGAVYGTGQYYGGGYGRGGGWGRGGRTNTVVIPWGVPMIYGGGMGFTPEPPMTQTIIEAVQPPPSVIINQYYTPETARPEMKEYSNLPAPIRPPHTEVEEPEPQQARRTTPQVRVTEPRPAAPKPPAPAPAGEEALQASNRASITLLAFKDASVVAAIAYWQQADELHYVTSNYDKRIVSLLTLDTELSRQLNNERRVAFRLESVR